MVLADATSFWMEKLDEWFEPFAQVLKRKQRCRWAPTYLKGLLGPGERKSIEPIAERFAPGEQDQLNHFVNVSPWDDRKMGEVLISKANSLVGSSTSYLIIDDTALVKKGKASVGVAHQYCGELGKKANCQTLVSLTLARGEVPVPVGLRLFLPQAWADDKLRRTKCGVPDDVKFEHKWEIALDEIDRVIAAGAEFGTVLADAGYGHSGKFREGLRNRELRYAVGVNCDLQVYPAHVTVGEDKSRATGPGRPRKRPLTSVMAKSAKDFVADLGENGFGKLTWRKGTKGGLEGCFAVARVRIATGRKSAASQPLPSQIEEWLICEKRKSGERRYYLSNLPPTSSPKQLAAAIKARWVCEQMHQHMKREIGLDHYEGRLWRGLHHHAMLSMIAMCFLQFLRLQETGKKRTAGNRSKSTLTYTATN